MQVEEIRNQFSLFRDDPSIVYLDSGASSQKPDVVIDAVADFAKHHYANVHRGIHRLSQESTIAFENARTSLQKFLHAPSEDEIIFVRGLTEGMNMIAQTFGQMRVRKDTTILLSQMEHHSNIVPWMILAEQHEANIKYIPVDKNGELDMHIYREMLTEDVVLVSVTHVSNVLGTINPIEEISSLAKQRNIPVIVDGAQAPHHLQVDVQALGCDFYVITGHKMYGPTGIGAVWGKAEHLKEMPVYHGGGEMVEEVDWTSFRTKNPPAKFEAGTPNILGAIGLGKAIDFIKSVGWHTIHALEADVSSYCLEALSSLDGIRILGSPKNKVGVYAFEVGEFHPADIATLLDQEGVAVRTGHHCAQPLHQRFGLRGTIRASLGIYNNREDIDRLIHAIQKAKSILG